MLILQNFWVIQGIGAVGLILVILAWNAETRRNILLLQSINLVLFFVHYLLLGALAGAAMCVVTFGRNVVFIQNQKKWAAHKAWFYFFILLSTGVLITFWKGPITILPVAGVILGMYAISKERPADIRFFMFSACIIWIPYTLVVHSYSGLLSQLVGMTGIAMGMYRHDRKKPIRGIIFDFNGVLLLDTPWHDEAWKLTSQKLRNIPFSDKEMSSRMHGRTNKDIFEYLLGRKTTKEELLELIQAKEDIYRKICLSSKKAEFKLSPGAEALLNLIVANNIPHTIATSSEITNVNFFIEHLSLEKWFKKDLIIFDNGAIPGKPEPDFYLLAAAKLNLTPQFCMVVEDSISGIEAARRAGIGKIIAFGPKEKFAQVRGVKKIISRLDEITLADFG